MTQEGEKEEQEKEVDVITEVASKTVEAIATGLTTDVPVVITAHFPQGAAGNEEEEEVDFGLIVQKETTCTSGDILRNIMIGGLILASTGVVCLYFYRARFFERLVAGL